MSLLKHLAARLPDRWQTEMKRVHFARQIKYGTFETSEPEFKLLHNFIQPGDWVIDAGTNVGHYTRRFSELAGAQGRVLAFEPVPVTFSLLAANAQHFPHPNVSLFNIALSDRLDVVSMEMPDFRTGLANYYEAHLAPGASRELSVLTLPLDQLGIDQRVSLVKIDVEGHEAPVLAGMRTLIGNYHPVLIVETGSGEVIDNLAAQGYSSERLPNSPNVLFKPRS